MRDLVDKIMGMHDLKRQCFYVNLNTYISLNEPHIELKSSEKLQLRVDMCNRYDLKIEELKLAEMFYDTAVMCNSSLDTLLKDFINVYNLK